VAFLGAGALGAAALLAIASAHRPPPEPAATRVATLTTPRAARDLATWLAASIGAGRVTLRGRRVAFADPVPPVGDAALIAAGAGLLIALEPAARAAPATCAALTAAAGRALEGGRVLDVARGDLGDLAPATRLSVWRQALADATGVRGRDRSDADVSTHSEHGAVRLVFIAPRTLPPAVRAAWREHLGG
jgi:hypothetical protein